MTKKSILTVVLVLIIIGAIIYYRHASAPTMTTESATSTPVENANTPASVTPAQTATTSANSNVRSFTVTGSDESADVTTINVHKGDTVEITFAVDPNNTYHGGLDFRSSVVSSGTIAPGASKTVTFTANNSFVFTPYWPASNIKKPYVVSVVVE